MFKHLFQLTQQPDFDRSMLEIWAAEAPEKNPDALIREYSLFVARSFLDGGMDFWTAGDTLNEVMVALEFEAPELFWEVYTTFENYEVCENPDSEAVEGIKGLVAKQAV